MKPNPNKREDDILPYGCVGIGRNAACNRVKPSPVRRDVEQRNTVA